MPRTVFIINKPCLNILLSESSTDRIRAGGCIARSDTYFFCRAVAFAVMVITVCHIAGNSLVFLAGLAGAGIFSCIIHNNFYPFLSGKNILRSYFYIILKKLIEKSVIFAWRIIKILIYHVPFCTVCAFSGRAAPKIAQNGRKPSVAVRVYGSREFSFIAQNFLSNEIFELKTQKSPTEKTIIFIWHII